MGKSDDADDVPEVQEQAVASAEGEEVMAKRETVVVEFNRRVPYGDKKYSRGEVEVAKSTRPMEDWIDAHVDGFAHGIAEAIQHHSEQPEQGPFEFRVVPSPSRGEGGWTLEIRSADQNVTVSYPLTLGKKFAVDALHTWKPMRC